KLGRFKMKKRDLLTPIGITVGFIMISAAILWSGGREGFITFVDITSVLIVIGGLVGSLLINFKFEQIKMFYLVMREAFRKTDQKIPDLIQFFVSLSDRARRDALIALAV